MNLNGLGAVKPVNENHAENHPGEGFELSLADHLADLAVIGALFAVLAFQTPRFEAFESEKVDLLLIFASLIACVYIFNFRALWHRAALIRNPIFIGVALLVVANVISGAFSLSPARSLWGSEVRTHGLMAWLSYFLLFLHAMNGARRLIRYLLTVLVMISIPLCLSVLLKGFSADMLRKGSAAGHANYLSSWLILALPILSQQLLQYIANHRDSWNLRRSLFSVFVGMILLLTVVTLIFASSRGALLALSTGILMVAMFWIAQYQKIKIVAAFVLVILVLVGGYFALSYFVIEHDYSPINRIFQPYDPFRIKAWESAFSVLKNRPLVDICGTQDRFSRLRPLVGYGPDNLDQTQSIFGVIISRDFFLDRFHNHTLDSFLMLGALGLFSWLMIYTGIAYVGLRRLGLLPGQMLWNWIQWQMVTAAGGAVFAQVAFLDNGRGIFLPAGAVMGFIGGLILWIGTFTFLQELPVSPAVPQRNENDSEPPSTPRGFFSLLISRYSSLFSGEGKSRIEKLTTLIFMAALLSHWVDMQFGFTQAASEPLWWILLGLFLGTGSSPEMEPVPVSGERGWHFATVAAGAVMLHSSAAISSEEPFPFSLETEYLAPLLATVFLAGVVGLFLTTKFPKIQLRRFAILVLVAWGIMLAGRWASVAAASTFLVRILQHGTGSAAEVRLPFLILSISGVVMITLFAAGYFLAGRMPVRTPGKFVTAGLLAFMLIGVLNYSGSYAEFSLHRMANLFAASDTLYQDEFTQETFQAATIFRTPSSRFYMDWLYFWLRRESTFGFSETDSEIEGILERLGRHYPFFNNTLEWNSLGISNPTLWSEHGSVVCQGTPD